jgi:CHASE2 domain-containing sensor protein
MRRARGIIAAFLVYLLACSIPFLIENAAEFSQLLPGGVKDALGSASRTYQRWLAGPRGAESRYTALVALNQAAFPGAITEACRQREIIATLLPRLVEQGPQIIAIDLAFLPDSCPPDPHQSWTPQLKAALAAASARVPIVLGQSARDLQEVPEEQRRNLTAQNFNPNGLLLNAVMEVPGAAGIRYGLMRTNADFRRVPLEWPAYEMSGAQVNYLEMRPSLSLAAARLARSGFPAGSAAIDDFVNRTTHPYTTLLAEEDFIRVPAADLLCGTSFAGSSCATPDAARQARERLRGKIAVVAWQDDARDVHATPVGNLPGALLHANFIESLLDNRLFHPLSFRWQAGLSLLWFALIEWPFHIWPQAVPRAFLAALGSLGVFAFVIYYVVVINTGWYLALLPPSVVALMLRSWYQWSQNRPHKAAPVP